MWKIRLTKIMGNARLILKKFESKDLSSNFLRGSAANAVSLVDAKERYHPSIGGAYELPDSRGGTSGELKPGVTRHQIQLMGFSWKAACALRNERNNDRNRTELRLVREGESSLIAEGYGIGIAMVSTHLAILQIAQTIQLQVFLFFFIQ